MGKLIKPKHMDDILSKGIVLHSKKQYNILFTSGCIIKGTHYFPCNCTCAVRSKRNLTCTAAMRIPRKYQYGFIEFDCTDVDSCTKCFLNAGNYLNVLKYIKHHGKINKA